MKKVEIDDFTRYKFLSGIRHSPDGKHACFIVHQCNLQDNEYISNLWIFNAGEERSYQLTAFNSEKSFVWVDNETILFPAVREAADKKKKDNGEEFTQYYKINIHGGEAVKHVRIPRNVNSVKIIDSETYVFASDYHPSQKDMSNMSEEQRSKELARRKEARDYEVLEEIPFWENGQGFTSRKRQRLYIYYAKSGKVEALTDELTNVEEYNLSKDKNKLVIVGHRFKDLMPLSNLIMIYDFTHKQWHQAVSSDPICYSYADFVTSDSIIAVGTDMKNYGVNENEKFYIFDFKLHKMTCVTPKLDLSIGNSVGSDCRYGSSKSKQVDNGYLYFVSTEGNSSFLKCISQEGNIDQLTAGEGSVDGISVSGSNKLFIGMRSGGLQELFTCENGAIKQVTHLNAWVAAERKIAWPEMVTIMPAPGVMIDGWIIKPADYMEGRKYPAILDIHGGPKTVYGTVYFHEMQYWASQGYVVFCCNPRGSDGKGNEFADIRGKYGTIDYEDIMKFTDTVIEKFPFIDSKRIGVTGGSYGGFMTNWIIGHTERFKAAASQRSISNWISKFCTTDIGYFFVEDQNAASPWANQEKLWQHSPLKYADKVKTPTLFLHSEEDYRCWIVEGIQMFTALKLHGVESRLCMFRGENHELSRSGKPKHRLRRLQEITEWFNHYLK